MRLGAGRGAYRCWKTLRSEPGLGRLCEPLERRSRIDWLSCAALGPVSEKLRYCGCGGVFDCRSAVHVCVPPLTFILPARGTADTCAVRPPLAEMSMVCWAPSGGAPFGRLMKLNAGGTAFARTWALFAADLRE